MSIKKILLTGFFLLLLLSPSWAKTIYLRDGGGNAGQCTGLTNAVYPGSGTGQPCAYNNPGFTFGYNCTNYGGNCSVGGTISAGDTVFIDGDSDITPGAQATYTIGFGSAQMPSCTNAGASECTLGNLPASVSIIGTGTHKPLILTSNNPWQAINANNNNITLQWLEIASHSKCGYQSPTTQCSNGEGSNRTTDGITMNGSGANYTDVYIHGFSRYGIVTGTLSGTNTFTRTWIISNGYAGFTLGNNDSSSNSGTIIWNQPIVEWNGCLENFPLTSGIDSPTDHKNCYGQGNNGYGDGIAFGPSGSTNAGSWTIIGPGSISFNTQDGFDTLHGSGNGTMQIDKMRFEGNGGNQVKMNALTSILTNNVIIGDCGWWLGSANAASGAMLAGDVCRALGDATLINVINNSTVNIFNNTILSNGNITLGTKDINGAGCNGSTAVHVKNNLILGGYAWYDDTTFNGAGGNSQTTYFYNNGNNGNGAGTCGNLVWDEDYNILSGGRFGALTCNGAHDKCNTAPGFSSGTFPMGTPGGANSTYYQGTQAVTLVKISSGSAANGAGVSGLTYFNNKNDYYNIARPLTPSVGGEEPSSCAVGSFSPCFYNSDCCGNACNNNSCGSCVSNGSCSATLQCGSSAGLDNCGNACNTATPGTCTAPQTCGGGGTPNFCGTPTCGSCIPTFSCGSTVGTCSISLAACTAVAGTCSAPNTCGGGGTPNVCGSIGGTFTCTITGKVTGIL